MELKEAIEICDRCMPIEVKDSLDTVQEFRVALGTLIRHATPQIQPIEVDSVAKWLYEKYIEELTYQCEDADTDGHKSLPTSWKIMDEEEKESWLNDAEDFCQRFGSALRPGEGKLITKEDLELEYIKHMDRPNAQDNYLDEGGLNAIVAYVNKLLRG